MIAMVFNRRKLFLVFIALAAASGFLLSCATPQSETSAPTSDTSPSSKAKVSGISEQYTVVNCLLPGRMRRLGTHVTFVTARRPTRTTAEDCAIRGGEYTASDRADYKTSLKLWLDAAQEGDPEAQYYVGTLYEKGPKGRPDYTLAAVWYEKAANQGYSRAAINLGRLHENGLGVNKDSAQAFKWYAQASGLDESDLSMLVTAESAGQIQTLQDTVSQRDQEIKKLEQELSTVTGKLNQLRDQLQKKTSKAQEERHTLDSIQQRVHILRGKLDEALTDPAKAELAAQYKEQLRSLQLKLARTQHKLEERDNEIARLQGRIASLEQEADQRTQKIQAEATGRIQALEEKVTAREREIGQLRQALSQVNQKLIHSRQQLEQQTHEVTSERNKLQLVQTSYQRVRTELDQALANHEQQAMITQYKNELASLKIRLEDHQQKIQVRNEEVATLQQKIGHLEKEAATHTAQLAAEPINDLGFAGPTIEIIDPPLVLKRGIKVGKGTQEVPTAVGVEHHISGRIIVPAGLRTLTVNGIAKTLDANGIFTITLPALQLGQEGLPVEILAIDIQNKRAATRLLLMPEETVMVKQQMPAIDLAVFGGYYALVIGNNDYQYWTPLKNAVADATAVADILQHRYGFKVTLLKNATRKNILKALNSFRKTLTEKDNLLIYYAGHGHLESEIDRGYWIPVDAELDDTSEWILTPSITDLLQLMTAKHVLIVADSCFAGKLTRSSLAKLRPGLTNDARMTMLKTIATKRVRTALTSGGEHPVLDVGGKGHSVFTEAFLGVLKENNIILETERLFWAIRTRVVHAAKQYKMDQIPTYWPIQFAGHESLGDFIFVPRQS